MNKEKVAESLIEFLFPQNEHSCETALLYKNKILENEISSAVLVLLNESDLKELGFEKLGHRKKVMQWIENLKNNSNCSTNTTHSKKRPIQETSSSQPTSQTKSSPLSKKQKVETSASANINFEGQEQKSVSTISSLLPFDCPICYDTIEKVEDAVLLDSCNHLFCKSCIQSHLKESIASKLFPILCPFVSPTTLKHEISPHDCKQYLSSEEWSKLETIQLEFAVVQNNNNNTTSAPKKSSKKEKSVSLPTVGSSTSHFQEEEIENPFGEDLKFCYCPTPNCGYIIAWNEKEDDPHFRCDKCTKHYCLHCKVPFHYGLSCLAFKKANLNRNKEDALFLRFIRQNQIKQCPQCMRFVEKRGGCNSITCICGNVFCYMCGKRQGECTCGGAEHEMPATTYAWRTAAPTTEAQEEEEENSDSD